MYIVGVVLSLSSNRARVCVCVAYMYMSLLGGMYVCGDVSCNMKVDPISGTVIRRSRGEKTLVKE